MTSPEDAIEMIHIAGAEYASAVVDESELEDQRALVKRDAIRRIVGTLNDTTGKPHSASSAEAVAEGDEQYANHRIKQRAAVQRTILARAQYEAAKRNADLIIGLTIDGAEVPV